MKSILVTGSNGLLGHHVVNALLEEGYYVTGVSTRKESKCEHERFSYISVDLTRSTEVERIFMENDFSHVIHLAAIAHVFRGREISWSRYYRINTMVSRQVFECSNLRKIPIFYASTVDVYGISNQKTNEESEPQPVGYYAKSKFLAEKSLMELNSQSYLIARFAPIYTEDNHRDIHRRYYIYYPKICYLIGNGMEYEFLSCKNAINLILMWVKSPDSINGIVNVCDAKRYNTKDLISLDKQNGIANRVIWIPIWLKKLAHIFTNIVFYTNPLLKFTAYKIINPLELDYSKLNQILQITSTNKNST